MSDSTFDPKAIIDTYKNAFAPVLKAQQEGITAIDRVGRYQYAVAGDYLEWSLAQAKAALGAQTPAEFVCTCPGVCYAGHRDSEQLYERSERSDRQSRGSEQEESGLMPYTTGGGGAAGRPRRR